jgi:hypothetical protein
MVLRFRVFRKSSFEVSGNKGFRFSRYRSILVSRLQGFEVLGFHDL